MATVYRAYQPSVGRFVAVKVIRPSIVEDPQAMARFQREARVVARLEHPHVLPIYDFSLAPPYLVMRYLEGGTLKDVLFRRQLRLREIGFLLRQVAAALDYAHHQGVVHRDVKPSNVLIDGQGNAFVGDFGIARVAGQEMTQSGALMGTPGYIAPEQITGRGIDHRADLYSLGVMAFEMLTGQLPYPAENMMEALFKHVNEPVPSACALNADLPVAIDEVLRRALAKDPAERYGTASALTEAVVDALGEDVAHTPGGLQRAAQASIQRIAERREENKEELEATMARFTAERGGIPVEGLRHTPTERNRLVTALYANLAEYADVAQIEGAEAVRDTLERLWERLERVITDRGGTIQVRTYEMALVLWGVEAAREDDPERAIRAALDMRSELQELLGEGGDSEPLPMQVSIATGLALLTSSAETDGSSAPSVTASGPAISLAHRLERVAPPGGILISHDTYRHVRGVFEVEAGDPLRIRGRRRPLETYLVRSAKSRAIHLDTLGVEGVETRTVGRRAELERLQEAFYAAAEDGATQVVTVVGEPGLGKSRLLYEFSNWMELEGQEFWLAWGRATPEMAQRPYALLRDLFSYRFELRDSDSPAEARAKLEQGISQHMDPAGVADPTRIAHFIGHLIGFDYSDSPHLSAALANAQGFHQEAQHHLEQFWLQVARRTPVVIELADIHWADGSSLDAINGLVRGNPELPLLVVCLARPELYERRPAWGSGQPFHTRLDLRPLTRRESRRLVAEILQKVDEVPDALRDLVVDRAEGNPFYIEELIKVLIEDRVIVTGEDAWRVEPERLSPIRVPSTLTGLVQARLDGLFPSEQAVLQRAAVIGRIFWDDAVRTLGQADALDVDVAAALSALSERGFVHPRAESAFGGAREHIFASNVLRDVAREGIPRSQRRAYQALVAEWLIQASGERLGEYAGAIADHLEQAGQSERAIPYLRQAGERAAARYANAEALAFFSRALDLLPEERREERFALTLAREDIHHLQGTRGAQERDLEALQRLSEALGSERDRLLVVLRRARHLAITRDAEIAAPLLQEASPLIERVQDVRVKAQSYLEWGGLLTHSDHETARTRAERAVLLAHAAGLKDVEAQGMRLLGQTFSRREDWERAIRHYGRSLQLSREIGDRRLEGDTCISLAGALHRAGDDVGARRYLELGVRLSRETGNRSGEQSASGQLATIFYDQGDLDAALDHFRRGVVLSSEIHALRGELVALTGVGRVYEDLGGHADALAYFERRLSHARAIGDRSVEAFVLCWLGLQNHYLGEDDRALARAQEAVRIFETLGDDHLETMGWMTLGHALAGLGDLDGAGDAYRRVWRGGSSLSDNYQMWFRTGPVRVAVLKGEATALREAMPHVEKMLRYWETHPTLQHVIQEPFEVCWTSYRLLRALGDPRAPEVLARAHDTVEARAASLKDPAHRRAFLDAGTHRRIVAEYEKR